MAEEQQNKKTLLSKIKNLRLFRILHLWVRKATLPGFRKMPIYDVVSFFFHGIRKSSLLSRANSLSFTFTLAVFPSILFLFTLIPFIPIEGLQASILNSLSDVLPDQVYSFIEGTISQIVTIHNGKILSLGFVMAFYFASRGVIGIMKAFNRSAHIIESRPFFRMQLISFALLLILFTIVIIAAGILIITPIFLKYATSHGILAGGLSIALVQIIKWLVLALLVFLSLSFIYYLAPAGERVFRFLSPGSIMATFLALVFIGLFNLYIDNFGQYNKLYGSIGTIIVLMIFINVNAIALLIGFELNASIYDAHQQQGKIEEDD